MFSIRDGPSRSDLRELVMEYGDGWRLAALLDLVLTAGRPSKRISPARVSATMDAFLGPVDGRMRRARPREGAPAVICSS